MWKHAVAALPRFPAPSPDAARRPTVCLGQSARAWRSRLDGDTRVEEGNGCRLSRSSVYLRRQTFVDDAYSHSSSVKPLP